MGFVIDNHAANIVFAILNLGAFAIGLWMRIKWGPGDMSRVKLRGSYDVGFKELYCNATGAPISVFYPVDQNLKNKSRGIPYFRYRVNNAQIKGLKDASRASMPFFPFKFL